jgi:hypothetical protein
VEAGIALSLPPESSIQEELRLGMLSMINVPRMQAVLPIHVVLTPHQLVFARVIFSFACDVRHRPAGLEYG